MLSYFGGVRTGNNNNVSTIGLSKPAKFQNFPLPIEHASCVRDGRLLRAVRNRKRISAYYRRRGVNAFTVVRAIQARCVSTSESERKYLNIFGEPANET